MFTGNRPPEDWDLMTSLGGWDLYVRESAPPWLHCKLVLADGWANKANYWLPINAATWRPTRRSDWEALRARMPDLARAVRAWLRANLG